MAGKSRPTYSQEAKVKPTHIAVRTREGVERFRRAGFAFQRKEPLVIALADLLPEKLAAIRGEPQLEVVELEESPVEASTPPDGWTAPEISETEERPRRRK